MQKLDEAKEDIGMMYQWLSIVAMDIKLSPPTPPPTPSPISPPIPVQTYPAGDPLLSILLVVTSLAFFGLLITVIWMFRTGRWQTSAAALTGVHDQAQSASSSDIPPPAYQPQRLRRSGSNPSFSRNIAPNPPVLPRRASEERTFNNSAMPLPPVSPATPPQREDLLRNKRWLGLAEDCTNLFDELDDLMPTLDPPRQEISRHVKNRLKEILIRSGVEVISRDRSFDESRHELEHSNAAVAPGTPIVAFVSPGFAVERRVLRRAVVRVTPTDEGQQ